MRYWIKETATNPTKQRCVQTVTDGRTDGWNDRVDKEALKTCLSIILLNIGSHRGEKQPGNAVFTQGWWTDGRRDRRTDGETDKRTDGRTDPLMNMHSWRTHQKTIKRSEYVLFSITLVSFLVVVRPFVMLELISVKTEEAHFRYCSSDCMCFFGLYWSVWGVWGWGGVAPFQ